MSHCVSGSINDRTTKYPLRCVYISTLLITIIIMEISTSMRLQTVKSSRKSGTEISLILQN